jgi:hypothetical protein
MSLAILSHLLPQVPKGREIDEASLTPFLFVVGMR